MRVGIVGAGQIAEAHLTMLAQSGRAEVVSLCDLMESPLIALQEKYSIPSTYCDYSKMLAEADLDVIHITTPPGSHKSLAIEAIEAGCHVYIEKPFTVTLADASDLLKFAEEKGRKLCLGVNHVFSRAQKKADELIKTGQLGQLTHIDAIFSYDLQGIFGRQVLTNPNHWIAKLPGQVFQNNLNHPLAAIVPHLSDNFEVTAWAADWSDNAVVYDELRVQIIDLDNRTTAYIIFSSNVKPSAFKIRYFGTKQALSLNNYSHTFQQEGPTKLPGTLGQIFSVRAMASSLRRQFWSGLRKFFLGEEVFFSDMGELFDAFYIAIGSNSVSPVNNREILNASRIIDEVNQQIGHPNDDLSAKRAMQ